MDSRPDSLDFGSAPSDAPDFNARPEHLDFGASDLDTQKWSTNAAIPAQPATWADVGHGVMAGVHGLAATGAGFAASVSGTRETEAGWAKTAQEQQQAAEESEQAMTPTVQGGWSHPLVGVAEQAPGIIGLAAPTIAATHRGRSRRWRCCRRHVDGWANTR